MLMTVAMMKPTISMVRALKLPLTCKEAFQQFGFGICSRRHAVMRISDGHARTGCLCTFLCEWAFNPITQLLLDVFRSLRDISTRRQKASQRVTNEGSCFLLRQALADKPMSKECQKARVTHCSRLKLCMSLHCVLALKVGQQEPRFFA